VETNREKKGRTAPLSRKTEAGRAIFVDKKEVEKLSTKKKSKTYFPRSRDDHKKLGTESRKKGELLASIRIRGAKRGHRSS